MITRTAKTTITKITVTHAVLEKWQSTFIHNSHIITDPNYDCFNQEHTHTQTHTHPFNGSLSGTTKVSRYQKNKKKSRFYSSERQSQYFYWQSGSGISWAICKSAPCSRQITMPAPHHSSFFTDRMPFLPPNQQCQSTEGRSTVLTKKKFFNIQ